jgi:hypothetical protein
MKLFELQNENIQRALKAERAERASVYPIYAAIFGLYLFVALGASRFNWSYFAVRLAQYGALIPIILLATGLRSALLHWRHGLSWDEVILAYRMESEERHRQQQEDRPKRRRQAIRIWIAIAAAFGLFALFAIAKDKYRW